MGSASCIGQAKKGSLAAMIALKRQSGKKFNKMVMQRDASMAADTECAPAFERFLYGWEMASEVVMVEVCKACMIRHRLPPFVWCVHGHYNDVASQ